MYLVKVFGKEDYEIRKFEESFSKIKDFEIKNAKLSNISNFSSSVLDRLISGMIALYGGYQLIKGNMTLGSLTAFMIYSVQLIGLANSIGGFYEAFTVNSLSCQRLAEILDMKQQIKDRQKSIAARISEGKIEFRNIYFGYKKEKYVLKGLNFIIPPFSKIALVGASGCGKTTLLNLILRLYEPDSGSILVDGIDNRDIKSESLKGQTGMVLQEPFLFNGTIANNILYAKEDASLDEIIEAARIAEAHNFISGLSKKYDTEIGENGCRISEGQKQRLAIARAVVKRPKILIIDEGLSSIDANTELRIIDNLKKEFADSTIIIVSHRLSTVQEMDLVYFLESPTKINIGTHNELVAQSPAYRELFANQITILPDKVQRVGEFVDGV